MKYLLGAALAASLTSSAHAGTISGGTAKVCDVRDYGAKGDGLTVDTASIQSAIDACGASQGGGTVRLGDAGKFLSGPIALRSHVRLDIEGRSVLLAARLLAGELPMVSATNVEDIAVTGSGTIDAAGRVRSNDDAPPVALAFAGVHHARIEGLAIRWAKEITIADSKDIQVKNIHIDSPLASSLGGLHVLGVQGATFENVNASVGTFGLRLERSPSGDGEQGASSDITVTHCTFGHGTGLQIASVNGLRAEHLHFAGTAQGIAVNSTSGSSSDLSFRDVAMFSVAEPLNVRADSTHTIANVTISDLTSVGASSAGSIAGAPGSPITGLTLRNVSLEAGTGLSVENARGVLDTVNIRVVHGHGLLLSASAAVEQK